MGKSHPSKRSAHAVAFFEVSETDALADPCRLRQCAEPGQPTTHPLKVMSRRGMRRWGSPSIGTSTARVGGRPPGAADRSGGCRPRCRRRSTFRSVRIASVLSPRGLGCGGMSVSDAMDPGRPGPSGIASNQPSVRQRTGSEHKLSRAPPFFEYLSSAEKLIFERIDSFNSEGSP